jgi:hypothetical protein
MMKSHPPPLEESVRQALHRFLEAAATASEASVMLTAIVLEKQKGFISDVTVGRETATLLLHVAQNLSRVYPARSGVAQPDDSIGEAS